MISDRKLSIFILFMAFDAHRFNNLCIQGATFAPNSASNMPHTSLSVYPLLPRCPPRKVTVKRNMWQRVGLGLARFVRHTICVPFYFLGALSLGVGSLLPLAICGLCMGNLYDKLLVIGLAPFAITFCLVAATFWVLHFPFRSFILTMRDKGDKDEEMIQEHLNEFKELIGLAKRKEKKV